MSCRTTCPAWLFLIGALASGCGAKYSTVDGTVVVSPEVMSMFSGSLRGSVFLKYTPAHKDKFGISRAFALRLADLCGMQGPALELAWSHEDPECIGETRIEAIVVRSSETGPCRLGAPNNEEPPSNSIVARDVRTIYEGSQGGNCEHLDLRLEPSLVAKP